MNRLTQLLLLALVAYVYADFSDTCTVPGDLKVPALTYVPGAPILEASTQVMSGADYSLSFSSPFVVNVATDAAAKFTRSIKWFITPVDDPTDYTVWDSDTSSFKNFGDKYGSANTMCKYGFGDATKTSIGNTAVSCSTSGTTTCTMVGTSVSNHATLDCHPKFTMTQTWASMRDATYGCWKEVTNNDEYWIYNATVWVAWQDFGGAISQPVPYPLSVSLDKADTENTSPLSDNSNVYVDNSFTVKNVNYQKVTASGVTTVTVFVTYELQTWWPYMIMPNHLGAALDVNSNLPVASGWQNPLHVPYDDRTTFVYKALAAGTTVLSSSDCGSQGTGMVDPTDVVAGTAGTTKCTFTQTAAYSWPLPAGQSGASCDAGSVTAFQMDFATCVYNVTGTKNAGACLSPVFKTTGDAQYATFNIGTDVNLCAAPDTDYEIIIKPGDANNAFKTAYSSTAAKIGAPVQFTALFQTQPSPQNGDTKNLYAARVWDLKVDDMTNAGPYNWQLVTTGLITNYDGLTNKLGNQVGLVDAQLSATITLREAQFTFTFTPNIGLDKTKAMIVYGDRSQSSITLKTTAIFRFYWDATNTWSGRRLLYRDQTITNMSPAAADVQAATSFKVSTTTLASPAPAMSTGAIAGIAVAGSVVVVAAAVTGALVYRRRRQVLEHESDTESKHSMMKV